MNHKKIPLNHHKKKYENVKFSLIIVSDTRYQQFKAGETPQDLTTPLIERILLKNKYYAENTSIIRIMKFSPMNFYLVDKIIF